MDVRRRRALRRSITLPGEVEWVAVGTRVTPRPYRDRFDHERLTFRHGGRDHRLTDVFGTVVHDLVS
jgi:hypothetical protein